MIHSSSQRGSNYEPASPDFVPGSVPEGVLAGKSLERFFSDDTRVPDTIGVPDVMRIPDVMSGFDQGEPSIMRLVEEVKGLEIKKGGREVGALDLSQERNELAETHDAIFGPMMERVKKAMEFLILKPAAWLGNCIKDHPFKTAVIVLAGFGLWYFGVPLTAGLSGFGEEGLRLTSELLTKLIAIDPSSIDLFRDLFTTGSYGVV
ncbi:hypothetical protein HYV57_05010 [Candidatus Peregrinibacteria bacterium]|nr:hypothetical protein [Candidatus Peregrinibacteria bacterium]